MGSLQIDNFTGHRCIASGRQERFRSSFRQSLLPRSTVLVSRMSLRAFGSFRNRTCNSTGRTRLVVRANELNKWANTEGFDDIDGEDDDGFDWDTSKVVLRVLTSRATQKVLLYLGETDLYMAQWLSDFVTRNPPLEGDKFIKAMFKERALTATDNISQTDHWISPTDIANRILTVRHDLSKRLATGYPDFVKRSNVDLLRSHLEANSYTSGTLPENTRRRKKSSDVR